jgi:hypothetical protein
MPNPQKHIPDDVWQLIYSFDPQYAKLQRIITINCPFKCNSQINYFISYYMKKILFLNEILQFPHWYVGRCLKLPNGSTRTTIGFCNRTYKQLTEKEIVQLEDLIMNCKDQNVCTRIRKYLKNNMCNELRQILN